MAKTEFQKQKLLAVMRILLTESDEEHLLTAGDIVERLQAQGIAAERKSIYDDIAALQDFGIDIVQCRGAHGGYFVASREFELPELKLLVDAVQFCRFITPAKSEKLIKKLASLCSSSQRQYLQGRAWLGNSAKTDNESILHNIDGLNEALLLHCAVSFKYFRLRFDPHSPRKIVREAGHEGKAYLVTPVCLLMHEENYYLVAYAEGELRHYRVDRIRELQLLRERKMPAPPFDVNEYAAHHFGMMGGELSKVRLRVHKDLLNVLADKFGVEKLFLVPYDEEFFECNIEVAVSPQFFGWLASFGDKIVLTGPEEVRGSFCRHLAGLAEVYAQKQALSRLFSSFV